MEKVISPGYYSYGMALIEWCDKNISLYTQQYLIFLLNI